MRRVSRESSRSWFAVNAVPIDATTGFSPPAQRNHVGVALDDDRAVLLRDRRPSEVQPVEDVRLVEELALGRVDVLASQRVVLVQLRAWKPITRPRASVSGNISRRWK